LTPPPDTPSPLISIVVPVFNEAETVAAVIARLLEIELPAPREIIVVNDGSSDGTRAVLDGLAATPRLTIIHADRNRGKGHAIRLGFARARGTVVAIQDADLELDPAQLALLVDPILKGSSSVVYGSRFLGGRPRAPWLSIAANRALTALTNAVYGSSLTDMETCYKIMRSDVARSLELTADRFDIEPEITARLLVAGHTIDERPVTFTPRSRAAGKKIGWRDGLVAVRVLLRLRPPGAFLTRALVLLALLTVLAAFAIAVCGGFGFRIAGVLVRAHRPAIAIGVALGAIALAATRGRARIGAASLWWWGIIDRGASPIACAVAIAAIATGWVWGTHVAGGSDSYCYLNEAELLAGGHVRQLQPDAADFPWHDKRWAFVPAGHGPAPGPDGAVVPICPSGYPLLMAAARTVAGRAGMFWIVPLMGGLAVWLTFVLGRRLGGAPAGVTAAVLFASSPIFLYQIVQPMNDVPAAALWLLALVLASRAGARPGWLSEIWSGAAAGAALVVRPNLLPLAAVTALWIASARTAWRDRVFSLISFGIAALPFVLLVMALQNAMYGGPLTSGYGDLGALFAMDHVGPNLRRYPAWLLQTHTPIVLLALAALWTAPRDARRAPPHDTRRAPPHDTRRAPPHDTRRATGWLLAFAAATLLCYLPYMVYDAWWYLRFVLPAVAVILTLTAVVAAGLAARLPPVWRAPAFALGCGLLAIVYIDIAARRHVFELQALESRFRVAGEYVAARLPADAAVVTVHQSGSVRFYSGRQTLLWDVVDPSSLDRALDYLRSRGYRPYLLFEKWEEPAFRKRFGGKSAIGGLDWPAIADINREVRIYDPDDRASYMGGVPIYTDRVWTRIPNP
jgi:hypothetical protein